MPQLQEITCMSSMQHNGDDRYYLYNAGDVGPTYQAAEELAKDSSL